MSIIALLHKISVLIITKICILFQYPLLQCCIRFQYLQASIARVLPASQDITITAMLYYCLWEIGFSWKSVSTVQTKDKNTRRHMFMSQPSFASLDWNDLGLCILTLKCSTLQQQSCQQRHSPYLVIFVLNGIVNKENF